MGWIVYDIKHTLKQDSTDKEALGIDDKVHYEQRFCWQVQLY